MTIRTEPTRAVNSPCVGCLVNGRGHVRASHIVLPPTGARASAIGLSTCDTHLERTQYVITHYADDEDKVYRLLKITPPEEN